MEANPENYENVVCFDFESLYPSIQEKNAERLLEWMTVSGLRYFHYDILTTQNVSRPSAAATAIPPKEYEINIEDID